MYDAVESESTVGQTERSIIYEDQITYGLFRVDEPDDRRFRDDPDSEIDRIVHHLGRFTSPSVEKALTDMKVTAGSS